MSAVKDLVRNPAFIARWKEALLGGEYEQTNGVLRRTHTDDGPEFVFKKPRYCCLGVALDLEHPNLWFECPLDEDHEDRGVAWESDFASGSELLSEAFLAELGLTEEEQSAFAALNDAGCTFTEIAAVIDGIIEEGDATLSAPTTHPSSTYPQRLSRLIKAQR